MPIHVEQTEKLTFVRDFFYSLASALTLEIL